MPETEKTEDRISWMDEYPKRHPDKYLSQVYTLRNYYRKREEEAKKEAKKYGDKFSARIEELRNLPCPSAPDGIHKTHGFCEANGPCEHCGLDMGMS